MIDPLTLALIAPAAAAYDGAAPSFQNGTRTCHVFLTDVNGCPCFAFEGTHDVDEWLVDFLAVKAPDRARPAYGAVHLGFLLDIADAVQWIATTLEARGWPLFYLCGHSKGAAEALLAHAELKAAGHAPRATRAYEPPRVGGAEFAAFLAKDNVRWTQTFNAKGPDIVTTVPAGPFWFQVGDPIRLAVPDMLGIAAKHGVGTVAAALAAA